MIRRTVAVVVATAALGMEAVAAWFALGVGAAAHRTGPLLEGLSLTAHLGWVVVGLLLVLRRPDHVLGWLALAVGTGFALIDLGTYGVIATHLVLEQPVLLTEVLAVVALGLSGGLIVGGMVGVLLAYPDGRLPSRRWRWLVWVVASGGVVLLVAEVAIRHPVFWVPTVDNPLGWLDPGWSGPADAVGGVLLFGPLVAAIAAPVVRWRRRRHDTILRQQLRWLVVAAVLYGILMLAVLTTWYLAADGADELDAAGDLLFSVGSVGLPVAILVAVTRYRLFDLDRLVSRTVSYTLLAGVLAAAYVGVVLGVHLLVPASGDLAVAGATLGAVALFAPLRRRVITRVDRAFNRRHHDGQRELDRFTTRLRDTLELDDIRQGCLEVVTRTMAPTSASVWLRPTVTASAAPPPLARPTPSGGGRAR